MVGEGPIPPKPLPTLSWKKIPNSLPNSLFVLWQINFAQPAEALHNFIRGNDKVSEST